MAYERQTYRIAASTTFTDAPVFARYPESMAFADNLKRLMTRRDISTTALAAEMGVTSQAISQWRSGATMPVAGKLSRLARLLGTSVSDLTDDSGGLSEDVETGFAATDNDLSDDEYGRTQQAVLDMLLARHLPHDQGTIAILSREADRRMRQLPRAMSFADRLEFILGEMANDLTKQWQAQLQGRARRK